MTLAHLPAGYVTCTLCYPLFRTRINSYRNYLFWGLLGSVIPDVDYLYLFLFDSRWADHHRYVTHYPLFWAALLLVSLFRLVAGRKEQSRINAFLFSLGGFLHMFLDTVTGRVFWEAPFSFDIYSVENFMFYHAPVLVRNHRLWSYSLEFLIILWAAFLYSRNHVTGNAGLSLQNEKADT